MILRRKENAIRNVKFGIIFKLLSTIAPFICRTVIIKKLGAEYLGLNSLFISILSVLSLAELGFGAAMVFSMYKPIAEDDHKQICALLNYYKRAYRVIGSIITIIGLLLIPFLGYLIKGDYPEGINIVTVYLINLVSVASTYFLFAYKNSIITAHQRDDVTSRISSVQVMVQYSLQISILFLFENYYAYVIIVPICNVCNNLITAYMAKKLYPDYYATGVLSKVDKAVINKKVRSLFIYKVGNVVSNTVDSVVISAFFGLTIVGIYGNYYYVITALFGFLSIYYSAMTAGLGNSIAIDGKEKNYRLFNRLLFAQQWLIGWISIFLLCLYQDFIKLCFGQDLMFDFGIVVFFVLYFYVWKINDMVHIFKEAAGLWEYDRFRPLISSMCNLILNILLIQYIGIYGVILSTVFCELAFSPTWAADVLFRYYFKQKVYKYQLKLGCGFLINTIAATITYWCCSFINFQNLLLSLLVKAIICCIIPNLLFIGIHYKSDMFKLWTAEIKSILKR